MRRARVEHGFREFFEFCFGRVVELGPGEGIVDDAAGIAVAAFKAAADIAQPGPCMREVMRAKSAAKVLLRWLFARNAITFCMR
jgi:hypothetical protein